MDGDGKGDGDGSYGQIEGEELTLEWLFERSKGAKAASGTIFNFAKKKTSSKKSSSSKKKTSSSKKSSSSSKKSSSSSKKSSTSSKSSSSSSKTSTASKVKNAVSKAVSAVKTAVTKAATAVKTAVSTATSKATTSSTSKKSETSSSKSGSNKKSTASTTKTNSNGGGKNKNDKGATSSMSGGKNKAGSTATSSKKETESKAKESSPKPETENTAPAKPSAASSSKQTGSKTTGNPRKQLTEGAKAIIADTKDGIHTVIDAAGIFIPAADAVNAALYSLEGNVSMAALSAVAIIPLAGEAAKGGKLLKNVAESSTDLKTVSKAADKVTKALSKKTKKTYKIKLAETAGKKADEVVTGGFKYVHNPSDNPKVLVDAMEDPKAVYGYRPNETGGIKEFSKDDWSNPELVNYYRNNRIKYHQNNDLNIKIAQEMRLKGSTDSEIAKAIVDIRNKTRLSSYIDESGNIIDVRKYNQALQHCKTYEELISMGKTDLDIINSSIKGNAGMDACCGLYDVYFDTYNLGE